MKISVKRIVSNDDATLSLVYIDGNFECFSLEDEFRENKVPGETRIPSGIYPVTIRSIGGFHNRYSKKFDFHRGMLEVSNVHNFTNVLIHIGNTEKDTAGCLLVGQGARTGDEISITSSTLAYKPLYQKVIRSAISGNLEIEYIDEDR